MKKILNKIKKLDDDILLLMKKCLKYAFYFCIFSTIILATYKLYSSPDIFYIGISLLKSGLFFIVAIIICGFAFQKMKSESI